MDFLFMFIKLIFALVVVIFLMMLSLRLSNKSIDKINGKRYMKVVDKVQLGKDSFIAIVKIGDKGLIMSVSQNKTEVLEEITLEEVLKIEKEKREAKDVPGVKPRYLNKVKNGWYRVKHSFKGVFFHLTKKKEDKKRKLKEDKDEKI